MTLLATIFLIVLLTEVVEWVGKPVLLQFVSDLPFTFIGQGEFEAQKSTVLPVLPGFHIRLGQASKATQGKYS